MIEWSKIRWENWMRVNWDESDNYTEWLIVIKLNAF